MKPLAILIALLALALPASADQAEQLYQMGMTAIQEGKPDVAEAAFRKALQLRPDHAQARYQLGQLPAQAENLKARRRESDLGAVKLATVDFAGVTLDEALAALGQMIEEQSGKDRGEDKALTPNFIVQDPSGALGSKDVTLRLKNVPAKVALTYLLQQVGATARYDEHATVIRPAAR